MGREAGGRETGRSGGGREERELVAVGGNMGGLFWFKGWYEDLGLVADMSVDLKREVVWVGGGAVVGSLDLAPLTSTRSSTTEFPLLWDRIRADGLWVTGSCVGKVQGRGREPRPIGGE